MRIYWNEVPATCLPAGIYSDKRSSAVIFFGVDLLNREQLTKKLIEFNDFKRIPEVRLCRKDRPSSGEARFCGFAVGRLVLFLGAKHLMHRAKLLSND